MFTIGDQIIYSTHGICKVEDISEKTVSGVTKQYYELRPVEGTHRLTISTPVDNEKVVMLALLEKEEAVELIETFKHAGAEWHNNPNMRLSLYNKIVNSGNRKDIAKVVNTLMRKKAEAKLQGKNLYERDLRLLNTIQAILFKEIAMSLDITFEEVYGMISQSLQENQQPAS